ncbi:hypothetical protein M5E87_20795 [Flavonifractor plautii]|nr:hypothetical protein M5E87_20795 [Flavonifractor plautii]
MANPQSNLDELMKDPKAASLLKNKALLQSLMQSPDTQRLMELLSQNAGDGLKTAAAKGDTGALLGMVRQVMQSSEGPGWYKTSARRCPRRRSRHFGGRGGRHGRIRGETQRDPQRSQAMGQIASLAQALTGEHAGESAPPPPQNRRRPGPRERRPGSPAPPTGPPCWACWAAAETATRFPPCPSWIPSFSRPVCASFPSTPPLTTARWPCSMLSSLLSSRSGMQRLTRPFRSPSWPGSSGWPSSSSRAAERRKDDV